MINNIDLDKLDKMERIGPQTTLNKAITQESPVKPSSEGVVVTNHLNKLVALLASSSNEITGDHAKIASLKSKIETGQYKINIDELADKMLTQGILRK